MHINTKCIQEGYKPKKGEARVLPIYQSTTFKYDTSEQMGDLFDLKEAGFFYSRLANPTVNAVEEKLASLEGGIGCMLTSSGQAANMIAVLNICEAGDHVLCQSAIYGGTYNLFNHTMRKMGIDFTFLLPDASKEDIEVNIKENTKCIFAESLSNPTLHVLDIELYSQIAHENKIPLIVDNTFPTPINLRPIEFGADIVTHSTTKYLDGHAIVVGGAIIDSGNFDWNNGNFPTLTRADETYHGIVYTEQFGKAAYIVKARTHLMRDIGATMSPQTAFYLNLGLETLFLRMERHSENARKLAEFLSSHEKVSWVNYPSLEGSSEHAKCMKYLPSGSCGVISFGVKGDKENAVKFMDGLKLAAIVTHVADLRTCVLHPASTTHRQLSDAELEKAGVKPDLIRMSVGLEHIDDIIADISQALDKV